MTQNEIRNLKFEQVITTTPEDIYGIGYTLPDLGEYEIVAFRVPLNGDAALNKAFNIVESWPVTLPPLAPRFILAKRQLMTKDLKVGETGQSLVDDTLFLRTFSGLVDLRNPARTWETQYANKMEDPIKRVEVLYLTKRL